MSEATDDLKALLQTVHPRGLHRPATQLFGIFYALHMGATFQDVHRAFGLSISACSQLANCLRSQPGKRLRYPSVIHEWNRLREQFGSKDCEQAFGDLYFRPEMRDRLASVIKARADNKTLPDHRKGANPDAARYAFVNHGSFFVEGIGWHRIDWIEDGWRFAVCDETGQLPEWSVYQGEECLIFDSDDEPPKTPFKISSDAFDAVFTLHAKPSPRRGRPKGSKNRFINTVDNHGRRIRERQ